MHNFTLHILEISNSLKTLYSNCSYAFFANLSDDLAESLPENKLERLKHLLTGKMLILLLIIVTCISLNP